MPLELVHQRIIAISVCVTSENCVTRNDVVAFEFDYHLFLGSDEQCNSNIMVKAGANYSFVALKWKACRVPTKYQWLLHTVLRGTLSYHGGNMDLVGPSLTGGRVLNVT